MTKWNHSRCWHIGEKRNYLLDIRTCKKILKSNEKHRHSLLCFAYRQLVEAEKGFEWHIIELIDSALKPIGMDAWCFSRYIGEAGIGRRVRRNSFELNLKLSSLRMTIITMFHE